MKRFVKEAGHADSYAGLTVDYVRGKKPHLILLDDAGAETERVDLAPYTTDELHALMVEKGFEKLSDEEAAANAGLYGDPQRRPEVRQKRAEAEAAAAATADAETTL